MDAAAMVPLLIDLLPVGGRVLAADPDVGAAVRALDPTACAGDDAVVGGEPVDAVLLLSGEVAAAGEAGPTVIDDAVGRTRPGGMLAVCVPSAVHAELTGSDEGRLDAGGNALTAAQLTHALQHRGLVLRLVAAPGAAARLAGRSWAGAADLAADQVPGLLDAGPVVLAAGRTPRSEAERSHGFFASITRRIVAGSVICRAPDGRLLVVHDRFRGTWTLPGGLVDEGESPLEAAVREAREEGGVDVEAGDLLGVFAQRMPERIHLIYAVTPIAVPEPPVPLHPHEITEARWVPVAEALELVDRPMRRKVAACLDDPGRTWTW
jgi:8-oxo-dGTP pyrophosphatase MutT (NUDIX family)